MIRRRNHDSGDDCLASPQPRHSGFAGRSIEKNIHCGHFRVGIEVLPDTRKRIRASWMREAELNIAHRERFIPARAYREEFGGPDE